ncbi:unnamed protein product [Adineta steineri]|uniref:TIR domain-containing protein n=1 Tax=Adineta steineri TaxID=433720 RepID=A0A815HR76_9BILA|nr:unnamed protein product [Adineta steineri]CAF3720142.1 unnamed protein product [Adineta steineri]
MDTSISITDNSTITNHNQQKRHIMISYDRSSMRTCRKIYNRLIERNYKVWMDLEHIQQYYESDSCRLEAEYAVKNLIKCTPCLMEEKFQPKSWLGIIKGSNVHIGFSSQDDFDESFEQLIRQITFIEK